MKQTLLLINEFMMGLSQFIITLFLMALVCGVGFALMVMSMMIFGPFLMVLFGGSFTDYWYFIPIGIITPYLFYNWIKISPSILELAKQEKSKRI